jgi:hypothetical protein
MWLYHVREFVGRRNALVCDYNFNRHVTSSACSNCSEHSSPFSTIIIPRYIGFLRKASNSSTVLELPLAAACSWSVARLQIAGALLSICLAVISSMF